MPVTIGGKSPKGRSHPGPILPPCTDPASSHSIGADKPIPYTISLIPYTLQVITYTLLSIFFQPHDPVPSTPSRKCKSHLNFPSALWLFIGGQASSLPKIGKQDASHRFQSAFSKDFCCKCSAHKYQGRRLPDGTDRFDSNPTDYTVKCAMAGIQFQG